MRTTLAIVLLLAAALATPSAQGQDAVAIGEPWKVKGKLLGEDGDKAHDVSGIACTATRGFPRACLIIDDQRQDAQLVTLTDGEIVVGKPARLIPLLADTYNGEPVDLDGEGVAYHDGFFYVLGSHGHPRHKTDPGEVAARIAASSRILRVRVDRVTGAPILLPGTNAPDVAVSTRLVELIANEPALREFQNKPLDQDGVTIEGIAIHRGRLYAGFRTPWLKNDNAAAVLSASLRSFFDGAAPDVRLHRLPLGQGNGVRDLTVLGDKLLVLSGPGIQASGDYAVFGWDGEGNTVTPLGKLPAYFTDRGQIKPEAIVPLDQDGSELRILIMFDGAKEGEPRAFRIKSPD